MKLIAGSKEPPGVRWRWALYYSKYAGEGFRLHRVRNNTFKRWNLFFDIPIIGGLSLYIQDVLPEEIIPPLPPLSETVEASLPSRVILHDANAGLIYTENFNDDFPEWKPINGGVNK